MKVTPVIEATAAKPYKRPVMMIHWNSHTVVAPDGSRHPLPAKQAWDLYAKLDVVV